jgi:iron complex outermembrane receptor protein
MKKHWMMATAALGTVLNCAPPAAAQEAQTPETSTGQSEVDAQGLADIVVTAQRRAEPLQKAPIAVSAVSGAALRDLGVTTADDLSKVVPALDIAPSAGQKNLFYLRGVGNFAANSLSSSAVAVNYNDVFISRSQGSAGIFFDLDRVEVLKGPQGTLYGVNATGGAVNVIPAKPRLGETSGFVSGEYGNYDAVRLEGALNLPLGDQAALRVSSLYAKHDGYLSDGLSDQDDFSVRASLRVEPADNFDLTLVADYFRGRGRGTGGTIISDVGGAFTIDDRVGVSDPRAQAIYRQTYVFIGGTTLAGLPNDLPFVNTDNWGVTATFNLRTSLGNLTAITAHRENSTQSNFIQPGFLLYEDSANQQNSLEVRLASDADRMVSYIVGGYLLRDEGQIPEYRANAQFNASFQKYNYTTTNYAGFGRINVRVAPDVTLSGGLRYTYERPTFSGKLESINRLCFANVPVGGNPFGVCPGGATVPFGITNIPTVIGGGVTGPVAFFPATNSTQIQTYTSITNDSRTHFTKLTWRAGADWKVTPNNLLYASFETGFKSGGFFFSNDANSFRPETIKAWTIGSKNSFLNNRIRLNAEAFYWIYEDQQVSHISLDSTGTVIFGTENVGRATFKGVELEAQVRATRTTLLGANIQYLDANYDAFTYNVPASSPPQTGCRTTPSAATATIGLNCSGFRPPNAPEWVIRLNASQTIPLGNAGELVLDASGTYRSETLTGLEFLQVEVQPSYWIADAGVTYNAPDDRFFIGAFIRNAFDEAVITNAFPPPLTSGLFVSAMRPPRTYGVRAGLKF